MSFIYFAIQTYAQDLLRHDKHGNCRDVVDLVLYVASSAESIDFFSLLPLQAKANNSTDNSRLNLIFMGRLVKGAGVKSFGLGVWRL